MELDYLSLSDPEKFDDIYNRITFFISRKSDIAYVFSHYYAKIKLHFYDSLPL